MAPKPRSYKDIRTRRRRRRSHERWREQQLDAAEQRVYEHITALIRSPARATGLRGVPGTLRTSR